jgi:hypothetical protein
VRSASASKPSFVSPLILKEGEETKKINPFDTAPVDDPALQRRKTRARNSGDFR